MNKGGIFFQESVILNQAHVLLVFYDHTKSFWAPEPIRVLTLLQASELCFLPHLWKQADMSGSGTRSYT